MRVEGAAAMGVGTAQRVIVDGTEVSLVRDDFGDFHAIGDTCTHGAVSLSDGEVEGRTIECWLHGSTFDLVTGRPLCLPATKPVPVFTATVDGPDVRVELN